MEFKLDLLRTITNDFSDELLVGSGEYGDVYKGVYNGKDIAVKMLHPLQGLDDEWFVNESRNLADVRHENVVRLIGFCCEFQGMISQNSGKPFVDETMQRALCFEYMQGGSLESHISDKHCDLDWPTCYKIIKGTCEGLSHLHNAEGAPIFHLDLRPANILLDKNMTTKISDLGLSRIVASAENGLGCTPADVLCCCCNCCGFVRGFIGGFVDGFVRAFVRARFRQGLQTNDDQETYYITEICKGKREYVPPEYIEGGTVSDKFDVFSLGVTIIKMMAGDTGYSRCCKMSGDDFTELVIANWNKRLLGTSRNSDIRLVQRCVEIGLRCVDADPHERPSINEIISTLKSDEDSINQIPLSSERSNDLLARMEDMHIEFDMMECIVGGSQDPSDLKLPFLQFITENFSDELKIGHGGCGVVYKGILRNGIIAVKRLFNNHTVDDKMFHGEVKTMITVNHKNVVRFLGYCSHTEEQAVQMEGQIIMAQARQRLLCFEYISNGSLQNYITDELGGLEWHTRYQIIKGICDGLDHLHREKHIIHMDLKPDNILLDNNMLPKITDFGLSRFDDISQTVSSDRRLMSRGYCAPEYRYHGKMSPKSDIYSLGVILIALLTGSKEKPNNTKVHRRWKHRWNISANDATLWYKQVATCLDLAQRCINIDPADRPNIWDIISDLNKMDSSDVHVSDASEFLDQLEDILGIEPLEIHLPFELNKQISCSIQLSNDTDDHFAFRISTTSLRPYCIKANKGTLPPRSKRSVTITLQAFEKAPWDNNPCWDEFIVQSTRVDGNLTAMDIVGDIFSEEPGKVVDTVSLTVILSESSPSGD